MKITIKLLQPGIISRNSIEIDVEPQQTIQEIKNTLNSLINCPDSTLRLLMLKDFSEILLTDEQTLESYNILNGSNLILDVFNAISMIESEARNKAKPKLNREDHHQLFPSKDWLSLMIEKVKIGSLTGLLQVLGEYEKERSISDEENDVISNSDLNGWTLLHFACLYGFSNIVQLLVARQANPNKENDEDMTPLMIACKEGHTECVRSLLKHPRIQLKK